MKQKLWGSRSKFSWGSSFELGKSNKATLSNRQWSWDWKLGKNSPSAELGKKSPQSMDSGDCRWGVCWRRSFGKPTGLQRREWGRVVPMPLSGQHRSHHGGTQRPGQGFGTYPKYHCLLLKGFEQGSEWHVLINILETFGSRVENEWKRGKRAAES